MRDLVGEDELDRALEDRIADLPGDVHQLVEDVAREPFEAPVDAGHARGRVLGARAAPEDRRLRELACVAAEVLEEAEIDLHVPRLVPHLAGHVERELPRRLGEIAHGAPGPLHRLHLAHHDPVYPLPHRVAGREVRERRKALVDLELGHLAGAHADEAVFTREFVVSDRTLHRVPLPCASE